MVDHRHDGVRGQGRDVALGRDELLAALPGAAARFTAALEATRDADLRVAAWHGLCRARHAAAEYEEAAAAAARGRAELAPGDRRDEILLGDELAATMLSPALQERGRELGERLVTGLAHGVVPSHPPLAALLVTLLGFQGRAVEHVVPLARAATARDPLIDPETDAMTLAGVAIALYAADELGVCRKLLDAAAGRARALGHAPMEAVARVTRAQVWFLEGRLDAAQAELEELLAARLLGYDVSAAFTITTRARVLLARGDVDGAAATLEALAPFDPHQPGLRAEVGWLRLAQGRPADAREEFLASGAFDEDVLGFSNPGVIAWRSGAARALLALGDRRRAAELAGEEVRMARDTGGGRSLALALSTLGTALGGAEGLEAHAEAVAVAEASPSRVCLAPVLVEHGEALRRAGHPVAAREPLHRALRVAEELGMTRVAERSREELRVAGGRVRRTADRPHGLTAAEERVARLAAAGRTTPEIAEQLRVSRRTVDTHLAAAYRKLGINSRRELPAALPA